MDDYEKSFITPEYSNQVLYKMSDMWRNEIFCDAILQAGQIQMKLHKLVLLCASPFLAAHSNDITEKMLTITLDIEVGASAMKEFASYLYFGSLHLTSENLEPIEAMAKLLKVESVIDFCNQFRQMFCLPIGEENTVNHLGEAVSVPTETHNSNHGNSGFGIKLSQVIEPTTSLPQNDERVYEDLMNENQSEPMEPDDDLEDDDVIIVNSCSSEPVEDKLSSAFTVEPISVATGFMEPAELEQGDVENESGDIEENIDGTACQCLQCGKKFETKQNLKRHARMHNKKFVCSICQASFQQNCRLKEHLEKHKTDKPFECPTCNKKFRDQQWMKEHIRFHHEGETPYKCGICDERFIRKSYRDSHYVSKHYKITLFVCKACGRNFSHADLLQAHQKECVLEGEVNHCEECDKYFKTIKLLKIHNRNVHNIKSYTCEICHKDFKTVGGLSKHKKNLHSDK
ncbi:hypothetical protein ScPMuIL_016622 [Solemya velum]